MQEEGTITLSKRCLSLRCCRAHVWVQQLRRNRSRMANPQAHSIYSGQWNTARPAWDFENYFLQLRSCFCCSSNMPKGSPTSPLPYLPVVITFPYDRFYRVVRDTFSPFAHLHSKTCSQHSKFPLSLELPHQVCKCLTSFLWHWTHTSFYLQFRSRKDILRHSVSLAERGLQMVGKASLWFCFCSVPGSWLPLYRWFNVCSSKVLPPSQVLPTWEPSPYSQLESGRSLFRLVLWFVLGTFPKCSSYLSRYSLILNLPSQADLRTSLTATLKSSFSWVSQTCLSSSASLYC